ncbi:hypothetical protein R1sor_012724 [Riccia sorocarpa]|uniref:Enoyl reductase (ER) domain-containing protein n=1 Tax=Riccia sorocarpa TaxID=122646 RepID=A0ABD3I4X4_9MARC
MVGVFFLQRSFHRATPSLSGANGYGNPLLSYASNWSLWAFYLSSVIRWLSCGTLSVPDQTPDNSAVWLVSTSETSDVYRREHRKNKFSTTSDIRMYRAIVQRGYKAEDPESTLEVVDKPIPSASPGHVVVHITLRPVNPYDLKLVRLGLVAGKHSFPVTVGSEGFGIVHSVGEGVTTVKPGQRVIPMTMVAMEEGNGSWQEYVSLKEEMVLPVPDTITDEAAAQFVVNPWTVIGLLRDIGVPKGEYLLQTAAGSVLGRQIIQLAKHKGIKTINLVRRPEQKEELKALGADEVICYTSEDVVSRVKEITGNKLAYGALDCVGGDVTKLVAASVRGGGHVFVYGSLASRDLIVSIPDVLRGVTVRGWSLLVEWVLPEKRKIYSQETLEYMESKVIQPLAGEKFDLAQFKEAIKKSEEVGRGGKVLLVS